MVWLLKVNNLNCFFFCHFATQCQVIKTVLEHALVCASYMLVFVTSWFLKIRINIIALRTNPYMLIVQVTYWFYTNLSQTTNFVASTILTISDHGDLNSNNKQFIRKSQWYYIHQRKVHIFCKKKNNNPQTNKYIARFL